MENTTKLYDGVTGQAFRAALDISPALGLPALRLTSLASVITNGKANDSDHYMLASNLRMERDRYGKNTHDHVLLALAVNVALDAQAALHHAHGFNTVYADLAKGSFRILATQAPHRAMDIIEQRLTHPQTSAQTQQVVLDLFAHNIIELMRTNRDNRHDGTAPATVPARTVLMLEQLAAQPQRVPQVQRAHLLAELDKAENPILAVPQDIMAEAQLVMAKWHDQPHEAGIRQRLVGAWLYTAQMLANPKDRLGIKDKPAEIAESDQAKLERMAKGALRVATDSPAIMAFLQQHKLLPQTPAPAIAIAVKPPELVGPVAHTEVVGPPKPASRPSTVPVRTWPVATTALKPVFA